jgi:Tol biopolymer transport system component
VAGAVALAVYLTSDHGGGGTAAKPPATPSVTPSVTPSATSSLSLAAQNLPRSAAPLADDVIVWSRERGGNWDLETYNVRDGSHEQLTTSTDKDLFAVVSTDRKTVVYEHEVTEEKHDLRVVSADGTGDRPLFTTVPEGCENVTRPAWSRDLEYLAVPCVDPSDLKRSLMLVKLDGSVVRELDDGALSDPAFTRDGKAVIYWKDDAGQRNGGALYSAPVDGSTPKKITQGGARKDNDPATSPVKDLVAFRRVGPGPGIWVAGVDGTSPTRLTQLQADHDPAWSPDGTRLVFVEDGDLWIIDADGSGAKRIVNDGIPNTAPAWSTR